jgi:hypothetical protein
MRFDIRHQIPQAFPHVIAGAQVMHIAKGPLDGVGARTIGRQKEQLKARVICEPLFDGYRLMDLVVIRGVAEFYKESQLWQPIVGMG